MTVRGKGRGGPNQEYALALADLLKDTSGIAALAADTDGADGGAGSATDPAGAMIDEATFVKMKSLGLDPAAYLANNDATAFFSATGDLLLTGPTLTNVNDVRVILVDPASLRAPTSSLPDGINALLSAFRGRRAHFTCCEGEIHRFGF